MIAKAVVRVLSFQTTDFPKVPAGQPPNETVTYYDTDVERDPTSVTVPIDRGIPGDQRPQAFGDMATVVLQIEQVERVVKRQDRDDAGRTYDSAIKQHKVKVVAFEAAPRAAGGKSAPEPVKAGA
jgi:hypothetical protein